jgi:NADH:ubiquinone oxidoreductase subunit 2 (subunit N)
MGESMKKLIWWLLVVTLIVTNVSMVYYHKAIKSLLGYMTSDTIDEHNQWKEIYNLQEELNAIHD